MTDTLCVLCRRRQPEVGRLCAADVDRLARHLDPNNDGQPFDPARPGAPVRPPSIPQLYRALHPGWALDDGADRANEHAISLRDVRTRPDPLGPDDRDHGPRSVLAVLGTWARVVHEQHLDIHGQPDPLPALARPSWIEARLPIPHVGDPARAWRLVRIPRAEPAPDVQAVTALCQWLHARLHWLAAQPWVDELVTDLRALTAALRAGQGDPGARPLGPCTALVNGDGEPVEEAHADEDEVWTCGEPLFMPTIPPKAPDEPIAPPAVRCGACGARWSGLELLLYARDHGAPSATEKAG